MKIIKRNGIEQEFNAEKIRRVISLANQSVSGDKRVQTEAELDKIFNYVIESISNFGTVAVETIQDKVRDAFMNYNYFDVADSFIKYRQMKANQKKFTESEEKILTIVNGTSEDVKQDNANKNPVILSTQRDYISGTECKAIARKILPKEIIDAHDKGLIHWHDMDYSPVQKMHNCFIGRTEFITNKGIRRFDSFKDGDKVFVLTKDGNWSEATVHTYGKQKMNCVILENGIECKEIICTPNHRWILKDETVTTNLKIGDILYKCSKKFEWFVKDIKTYNDGQTELCWCVEEPTTHSFTLKDDIITGNCELVNLKDMLENGFEMNGVFIDSPKSFRTACTLATQVAAQVAGQQYGGQTMSWTHIARYVDVSRKKIYKRQKVRHPNWDDETLKDYVEDLLKDEIKDGVQTFQYQVLTILCSNGQTPFISMSMNFDECEENEQLEKDSALVFEEVLRQRIEGLDDGKGNKISAIFPKLLYFLDECNAEPDSKYYWLTKLATECASKRMAPDFISAKIQRKLKHTDYTWPCMGCRSFLTPYTPEPLYDDETVSFNQYYKDTISVNELFEKQESGENLKYRFVKKPTGEINEIDHLERTTDGRIKLVLRDKYYGRNNNGVISINLPHVALESKGNKSAFWKILDSRLELIYRALFERYKSLKGSLAEAAPIQRRFGALFRLNAKDKIDHFLTGPYCTYSLGYVGLWETCLYMTGLKLNDDQTFANEILNFFNKKHDEWHKRLINPNDPNSWLNTSTYGTPEEQLTTKFANANRRDFGEVDGVTDHDYVTNSYHINPAQPIDAFTKISIESKLQDKSTGGAISYVELPNMDNNLEAVESVIQFMYNKILYCELNIRRDICYRCGFHGEIKMVKEDGKYLWECPACKNRDTLLMDIKRRVCGYIADAKTGMSQGRMGDMYVRVYHLN